MQRIAPKGGYDYGNKRQYRRNVWAAAGRFIKNKRDADVALMPSAEGDEIEVALSKGFRENRLHVIDNNPAIVATLKRRFPRIVTYGVDVVDALDRMVNKGVELQFINLDLCCTVVKALPIVDAIGRIDAFASRHMIALTVFRGREPDIDGLAQRHFSGHFNVLECDCVGGQCEEGHQRPVVVDEMLEEYNSESRSVLSKNDFIRMEVLVDSLCFGDYAISADAPRVYRTSSNTTMMYLLVTRAIQTNMKWYQGEAGKVLC